MNAETRRSEILKVLLTADVPVSASTLAKQFGVSRQTIVQDIALLRAIGNDIISLSRGYKITMSKMFRRVFKLYQTEESVQNELNVIVDNGGAIVDVFIYHRSYGKVRADMNIKNRADVQRFLNDLKTGKSSLLSNATSGYHYHTVEAETEGTLDAIEKALSEGGFIAPLQEYEPEEIKNKGDA